MPKCYSCTHYHGGFCELNGTHSFTGEICSSYEDEYESAEKKITREELRTTKRALWLARAEKAKAMMMREEALFRTGLIDFYEKYEIRMKKWQWVERKCRQKAEEYNV